MMAEGGDIQIPALSTKLSLQEGSGTGILCNYVSLSLEILTQEELYGPRANVASEKPDC